MVDDVQKESEPPKARLSTLQDDVVSGAKEQDEELAVNFTSYSSKDFAD